MKGAKKKFLKRQRHYFANKGPSNQGYGFSSSHVWMWDLGYKESWVLKDWCFRTVVLEKALESPLDCKKIQPVHPKGDQSWVFTGMTDVEAETLILWPPDELTHWKRPWCWERLKAGEGDDRGWDGWRASPTGWAWVWVNFGSWWWTGRPGMLQSMQIVRRDWATELNWTVHISDVSKFCPLMYTIQNQSLPLISHGILFLFFKVILFLKYWKQSNFSWRKVFHLFFLL